MIDTARVNVRVLCGSCTAPIELVLGVPVNADSMTPPFFLSLDFARAHLRRSPRCDGRITLACSGAATPEEYERIHAYLGRPEMRG